MPGQELGDGLPEAVHAEPDAGRALVGEVEPEEAVLRRTDEEAAPGHHRHRALDGRAAHLVVTQIRWQLEPEEQAAVGGGPARPGWHA